MYEMCLNFCISELYSQWINPLVARSKELYQHHLLSLQCFYSVRESCYTNYSVTTPSHPSRNRTSVTLMHPNTPFLPPHGSDTHSVLLVCHLQVARFVTMGCFGLQSVLVISWRKGFIWRALKLVVIDTPNMNSAQLWLIPGLCRYDILTWYWYLIFL